MNLGLLRDISASLAVNGMVLRGGFNFGRGEDAPPGLSGAPARTIVLVGQVGASAWPYFKAWRRGQPRELANPLDCWSRDVIGSVARKFGARAVSPSDRPFFPFQQWAKRAEGLKPSPLGILMHPVYGLWHAYRGALLWEEEIPMRRPDEMIHLCGLCDGKPCLNSCPAEARSERGFAHETCLTHIRSSYGEACRRGGCFDRNSCPHGEAYRYPAEMQAFHMAAFAA